MSDFPCKLYLSAPVGLPPEKTIKLLDASFAASDVSAVLYSPDQDTSRANNSFDIARELMRWAIDHNVAFIVAEDVAFAREISADGVHLYSGISSYSNARSKLGNDRIIGLSTALNRHECMSAGETGADYILFDPTSPDDFQIHETQPLENLISWWTELFEVPCVAQAYVEVEKNRALVSAGVDFLVLGNDLWCSEKNVAAKLKALGQLIAECGRAS